MDEIERALALSQLIESDLLTRKDVWPYTEDESAIVRKNSSLCVKKSLLMNGKENVIGMPSLLRMKVEFVHCMHSDCYRMPKKRSVTNGFRMHVTTTGLLGGA